MTPIIHPAWLRHDLRDAACWVAMASVLANFLPDAAWVHHKFDRWPAAQVKMDAFYEWFIDMVAVLACNWRICLPSLDYKFFGFARDARHAFRNWQQERIDRKYGAAMDSEAIESTHEGA